MTFSHWHYCRALCSDFERASRFVEISSDNFRTYSIEFTHLYLAAGSEIDVVAKQLCEKVKPSVKAKNINQYRQTILSKYPGIETVKVVLRRYAIELVPWQNWSNRNPNWWRFYNKVKHERHLHYREANLENTMYALGALLVMVGYYYGEDLANHKIYPMPDLMSFDESYASGPSFVGLPRSCYRLPGIPKPKK